MLSKIALDDFSIINKKVMLNIDYVKWHLVLTEAVLKDVCAILGRLVGTVSDQRPLKLSCAVLGQLGISGELSKSFQHSKNGNPIARLLNSCAHKIAK